MGRRQSKSKSKSKRRPVTRDEKAHERNERLKAAHRLGEEEAWRLFAELCMDSGLDPEHEATVRPYSIVVVRMSSPRQGSRSSSHRGQFELAVREVFATGAQPWTDVSIMPGVFGETASASTLSKQKRARPIDERRPVIAYAMRCLHRHAKSCGIEFITFADPSRYTRSVHDVPWFIDNMEAMDLRPLCPNRTFSAEWERVRHEMAEDALVAQRQAQTIKDLSASGQLALARAGYVLHDHRGGGLCHDEVDKPDPLAPGNRRRFLVRNANAEVVRRIAIDPLLAAAQAQRDLMAAGTSLKVARAEALEIMSAYRAAGDLHRAGIRTRRGKDLDSRQLEAELVAPRLAGMQRVAEHLLPSADIEAVMSLDEHELMVWFLVGDGRGDTARKGRPRTVTAGTGFGYCACGRLLAHQQVSKPAWRYRCTGASKRHVADVVDGIHGSARGEQVVDFLLLIALRAHQKRRDFETAHELAANAPRPDMRPRIVALRSEIDAVRNRIAQLDEDADAGLYDGAEERSAYRTRRSKLSSSRDDLVRRLRDAEAIEASDQRMVREEIPPLELVLAMTRDEQQRFCSSAIERWTLEPTLEGRSPYALAERITFEFAPGYELSDREVREIGDKVTSEWLRSRVKVRAHELASPELQRFATRLYLDGMPYRQIATAIAQSKVAPPTPVSHHLAKAIAEHHLRCTGRANMIRQPARRNSRLSKRVLLVANQRRPEQSWATIATFLNAEFERTGDAGYLSPRGKPWTAALLCCTMRDYARRQADAR